MAQFCKKNWHKNCAEVIFTKVIKKVKKSLTFLKGWKRNKPVSCLLLCSKARREWSYTSKHEFLLSAMNHSFTSQHVEKCAFRFASGSLFYFKSAQAMQIGLVQINIRVDPIAACFGSGGGGNPLYNCSPSWLNL